MYYYCSETVPQHRILFILLLELREFIRRLHGFEPEFTWDTGVEVEDRLLWDFTVARLLHHGLLARSPSYPGMLLTGALSVYIPRQALVSAWVVRLRPTRQCKVQVVPQSASAFAYTLHLATRAARTTAVLTPCHPTSHDVFFHLEASRRRPAPVLQCYCDQLQ